MQRRELIKSDEYITATYAGGYPSYWEETLALHLAKWAEQGKEATPKNIEELKQRFAEHLISKNNELDTSWAYAVEWTVKNLR